MMQSMDFCEKTVALGDFEKKWEAFGWNVVSINGNDHAELDMAFNKQFDNEKPKVIIANTKKGYGIPFMEFEKEGFFTKLKKAFGLKKNG